VRSAVEFAEINAGARVAARSLVAMCVPALLALLGVLFFPLLVLGHVVHDAITRRRGNEVARNL
jgi:hypothetical protein